MTLKLFKHIPGRDTKDPRRRDYDLVAMLPKFEKKKEKKGSLAGSAAPFKGPPTPSSICYPHRSPPPELPPHHHTHISTHARTDTYTRCGVAVVWERARTLLEQTKNRGEKGRNGTRKGRADPAFSPFDAAVADNGGHLRGGHQAVRCAHGAP